jgi:AcrR family transcriptional regulator
MARLEPEHRRRTLLHAGRQIWSSKPFDAVRPDDITAATGTSIGLVYRYFGSKRGFYVATVRVVAEQIVAATDPADLAASTGASTPHALLRAVLAAFVAEFVREGPLLKAVLRGGVGVDPEVAGIAQHVRDVQAQRVRLLFGLPDDPHTRLLLAGWIGFCEAIVLADSDLPSAALVDQMADALFRLVPGTA